MSAIPETLDDWVDELRARAQRHSIVFLQLGAAFEPVRRHLLASGLRSQSIAEYVRSRPESPGIVMLTDVEAAGSALPTVSLSVLRELVDSDIGAGVRFVLISRWPRIAYPDVPGSSLLEDSRYERGPLNSETNEDPGHVLPACLVDERDLAEVFSAALDELGLEVCASLDRALFESMMIEGNEALTLLSAREFEALEGAGIARVDDNQREWSVRNRLAELREALASTLAANTEPPRDLHPTMDGLWRIERTIRQAVRAKAQMEWGTKWRKLVLKGDLGERVRARATESAYAAAKSLAEIRDPLEWLTLGELLTVRERPEIGDLGVEPFLWKQFAASILPVRNRLTHMRLLQPSDAAEVTKWQRVLERKLEIRQS